MFAHESDAVSLRGQIRLAVLTAIRDSFHALVAFSCLFFLSLFLCFSLDLYIFTSGGQILCALLTFITDFFHVLHVLSVFLFLDDMDN